MRTDLFGSGAPADVDSKDSVLASLGERTRKGLAKTADVSERHLANVEMGVGNASIQFLRQVAQGLNCSLAEQVGDETASSPEWLMIREILRGRGESELAQARAFQRYPRAVVATPGGIVSDPATFNLLLAHCYSVWLRTSPEEHRRD